LRRLFPLNATTRLFPSPEARATAAARAKAMIPPPQPKLPESPPSRYSRSLHNGRAQWPRAGVPVVVARLLLPAPQAGPAPAAHRGRARRSPDPACHQYRPRAAGGAACRDKGWPPPDRAMCRTVPCPAASFPHGSRRAEKLPAPLPRHRPDCPSCGGQAQRRARDGAPSEDGRPAHRLWRRRQPVHHPAFRPRNRFLSCPHDANEGHQLAPAPLRRRVWPQPSLLRPEFTSLPRSAVFPLSAILVAFALFKLAIAVAIELFEHLVGTGKELVLRHIAVAIGVKTGEVVAALAILLVRALAMMLLLLHGLHFFQRHGTVAICIQL